MALLQYQVFAGTTQATAPMQLFGVQQGSTLVVMASNIGSGASAAPTFSPPIDSNNTYWTVGPSGAGDSASQGFASWYLQNAVAGNYTVTVTAPSGNGNASFNAIIAEIAGAIGFWQSAGATAQGPAATFSPAAFTPTGPVGMLATVNAGAVMTSLANAGMNQLALNTNGSASTGYYYQEYASYNPVDTFWQWTNSIEYGYTTLAFELGTLPTAISLLPNPNSVNGNNIWLTSLPGNPNNILLQALGVYYTPNLNAWPVFLSPPLTPNQNVNLTTNTSQSQLVTVNLLPGAWNWAGTLGAIFANQVQATPAAWAWAGTNAGIYAYQIAETPAAWNWAGTNAAIYAYQVASDGGSLAWSWAGTNAAIFANLVPATPGAWSWAGTTAALSQLIAASPGAWSWAGTTATFTQLIAAQAGTWSWAGTNAAIFAYLLGSDGGATAWLWDGTTATIQTGGGAITINSDGGSLAWSWAGTNAGIYAFEINTDGGATSWSWAGTNATLSQLVNSDGGAAAWSWAGTLATQNQLIAATPASWTWAGTTATFSQEIAATPASWSWAGTTASISQLIAATAGAYTWAGTQAALSQLIDSDGGAAAWSWAGTTATVQTNVTINAAPGPWTWAGTQSHVQAGSGGFLTEWITWYRRRGRR